MDILVRVYVEFFGGVLSRSPDICPLVPAVFLNLQVLYYDLELLIFPICFLRERQEKLVIDDVVSEKSIY